MIFFTILGVITSIYLLIGLLVVVYFLQKEEATMDEILEDPLTTVFLLWVWPFVVLEEMGVI